VLEGKLQLHLPGSALLLPLLLLLELWRLLLCTDFFLPLASTCRRTSNNINACLPACFPARVLLLLQHQHQPHQQHVMVTSTVDGASQDPLQGPTAKSTC
jgi:hypothetical protein